MEESDKERLALEALIDEASQLENTVIDLLFPYDRVFGIGIAIVVGALTIATGQQGKYAGVLALLPFVLVLLFGYALQVNAEMLSRAGHKRCLEEIINDRLGRRVLLAEQYVAPTRHGKFGPLRASVICFIALLLFLLATAAFAGFEAAKELPLSTRRAYNSGLALSAIMLVTSFIELARAEGKAYRAAKAADPLLYVTSTPAESETIRPKTDERFPTVLRRAPG